MATTLFSVRTRATNKLDHEIDSYDPVTGTASFWVRVPTLSHTARTVIYMQYGSNNINATLETRLGYGTTPLFLWQHMAAAPETVSAPNNGTDTSISYSAPAGKFGQEHHSRAADTSTTAARRLFPAQHHILGMGKWIFIFKYLHRVESLDASSLYFRHAMLIKSNGRLRFTSKIQRLTMTAPERIRWRPEHGIT